VLWLGFAGVWCLGWLLCAAMGVSAIWHQFFGKPVIEWLAYYIGWLFQWMVAGGVAFCALAWAAAGGPETITVTDRVFSLARGCRRLARTDHFSTSDIQNVRLLPVPMFQRLATILGFWGTGRGRVAIDLPGSTHRCGTGLTVNDAQTVVDELRHRLNLSAAPNRPPRVDSPPGPMMSLRLLGLAGTSVTLYMLVAGVLFPGSTVAMDFSTCTGDLFRPAYRPLDVSGLPRDGILYLVPFDDFPPRTVQSLRSITARSTRYRCRCDRPSTCRPRRTTVSAGR